MKQLKSKKTGQVSIVTDEEYSLIVKRQPTWIGRFDVTEIRSRPIVPSLKTPIKEVEKKPVKTQLKNNL
jgi:hypothetical protein